MLKSLFRLSVIFVTGAFLKPRIKGLLILIAFWALLWFLQSEYLNYVDYSGDANYVLQASIIKVGLILFSLSMYVLLIERRIYRNKANKEPEEFTDKRIQGDGFDAIRRKKKLRGHSEQLLNKDE